MLHSNPVNFVYKLDGDIEGVDVKDLSPILLSLGELIQEANKTINPDGREISVKVKPFQKGYFIVDIIAFAKSNGQQLVDFISREDIKIVKEVLDWIGLIRSGTCIATFSLIGLIKWLKGKPKSIHKTKQGEYSFINKDDESKNVSPVIYALFSNVQIQNNLAKAFGTPSQIEGVTGISTMLNNSHNKSATMNIAYEETKYFKEYEQPYETDDEIVNESEITVVLNPRRGSYQGDKGPYTFVIAGSNDTYSRVGIADDNFKQKLESGEIRLHIKDLIKARISIKQKQKNGEMQVPTYEIVEVLEYKKFIPPQGLFDKEPGQGLNK